MPVKGLSCMYGAMGWVPRVRIGIQIHPYTRREVSRSVSPNRVRVPMSDPRVQLLGVRGAYWSTRVGRRWYGEGNALPRGRFSLSEFVLHGPCVVLGQSVSSAEARQERHARDQEAAES
jgi:hypothetical protein